MKTILSEIKKTNHYLWSHKLLFLPIVFGYLHILAISLLNGNYVCNKGVCGIGIAEVLFHDPIWHMALTSQAFNSLPFQMPVFSGATLQSYHYLADFIYFLVSKIGFGPMFTYWKIMPHVFFFTFVYLAIIYARRLNKSALFVFSYIFFLLLGGTFSFIPHLMHTGKLLGAGDMFLQMNSVILSPNVGFSFIIFLIVLLIVNKNTHSAKDALLLSVCLFLQMGMKFYAGLTLFLFLNLYNLLFLLKKGTLTKFFRYSFLYALMFGCAAIVFYDPFSVLKRSSVFIFSPLTLAHPLLEDPNHYFIESLVLARYSLMESHSFSPRLLLIELFTIGLFFFHYLGTFNLGLLYVVRAAVTKTITKLEIIFFICTMFTVGMVIFFIQKGYYSDTLQFLYYSMFFMAYFVARTMLLLKKFPRVLSYLIIAFIFLLVLPNNITDMAMPYDKQQIIPSQELEALEFLRKQPAGAIATSQVDKSSYVPLFTHKQVYIADTQQLEITSLPYEERKKQIQNLYKIDPSVLPVQYFYLLKSNAKFNKINKKFSSVKFKKIYENKLTIIYMKRK